MRRALIGALAVVLTMAWLAPARAVIGGTAAPVGSALFVASLRDGTGRHACGATVLAPSWVLTAAHCADAFLTGAVPGPLRVVTGRQNQLDTAAGQLHDVDGILVHPAYDAFAATADVALLHLATPSQAPAVKLASWSDDRYEVAGTDVIVMGWGATLVPLPAIGAVADLSPADLQTVTLDVVGDAECKQQYDIPLLDQIPLVGAPKVTPDMHLCAATLLKDSCYGDSGGPLLASTPNGFIQIGVVSTGLLCAVPTHAGVYTEVNNRSVLCWIKAVTGLA